MFRLPRVAVDSSGPALRSRTDRRGASRAAVLFALATVLFAGLGFYLGNEFSQSAPTLAISTGPSPLQIDSKHLSFGEVLARADLVLRVPVQNVSGQDVEILEWARSCGACTAVEPESLTIPAGETREVAVTLDLTSSRPAETLNQSREFSKSIIPRVRFVRSGEEYRGPPLEWEVHGRVQDFVVANPPLVVCGESSIRSPAFAPFRIDLTYVVDIETVTAACTSAQAGVETVRVDGRQWRLDVTPAPENKPAVGEFRCHVEVNHTAEGGDPLPPLRIPVMGARVPDVAATVLPSPVLGTHPVGANVPVVVRLRSRTGSRFEVEAADLPSAALRVESIDQQGALTEYRLTKEVQQSGLEKVELKYHIKHADGFEEESTARIYCVGVDRL
ncbi:MAG: hypothetical protein AB7U20_17810 [Planctomycetaceae bacterium]